MAIDFSNIRPEDIIKKGKIPGELSRVILLFFLGILILIFLTGSFYTVDPDEAGVVRRFGRYLKTTSPGLHFKVPFGVDRVNRVSIKGIFKQEFGFRTERAGIKTRYSPRQYDAESIMLTGDLNIADVEWIVQYQINEPTKYLFNLRDKLKTIRDISESLMRTVVGDRTIDEVLTVGRPEIESVAAEKIQEVLSNYEVGIRIVTVKLQNVNPPEPVKPSFNEVNEAKQEKEKMINEAWEEYNKAIPRARGEAGRTIAQAEGFAVDRVNRSRGDTARFLAMLTEYRNAKEVTRKRLYLETMEEILPRIENVIIIDSEQKSILPMLQLEE